ncbi:prolyl oligopeptidase family serine peptidase, partial [Candidatus Gottesmanbacteria bacterium]|nr:prolyl oligopeptidase family serine peptidase [Candidatus Gottesmanbacteria bacterium]
DVLNAYSALEKLTFVNPSSIGLWGHSMAGNIVLRTLASKPQIPAGVIWAGAVYTYEDMQEFGINDNSYSPASLTSQRQRRRQQLREKYGDFNNDSSFWRQIAATNYLSDIDSAIQINHAIDDEVVNIGYSRNLNALLDKTNISHELNEYPGGGHNISGASFRAAMENTVRFFQDNL